MEKKIDEYRALLIDGDNKKFNGIAVFEEDALVLEKRSRFNGKLKESVKVPYEDIPLDAINRPAFNKLEFNLEGEDYIFKTIDDEELDEFEKKLSNRIQGIDDDADENVKIVYKTQKDDIPEQIRKYHDLYEDGIITEEEFESKKKELLNL